MARNIEIEPNRLAEAIARMAQNFDPFSAALVLLRSVDLVRARRVVLGHHDLPDALDRGGLNELLEGLRVPPDRPPGLNAAGPPVPSNLQRRFTQRLRMTDESVLAVVRQKDTW
jgi:hypothetical protein